MRFAPYFLGLCLGVELLACSSSSTTTTTIVRPELIAVSPDDFLGSLACGDGPDDVHSYVATLFDVTPAADGSVPDPGGQVPSSPPTSCTKPVTFSFVDLPGTATVILDHRYLAKVDAYQLDATALNPLAPGARSLVDAAGSPVTPSWLATCGAYPPSPVPDAGLDLVDAGTADAGPPGIISYAELTQTPHNCGDGLRPAN